MVYFVGENNAQLPILELKLWHKLSFTVSSPVPFLLAGGWVHDCSQPVGAICSATLVG